MVRQAHHKGGDGSPSLNPLRQAQGVASHDGETRSHAFQIRTVTATPCEAP